MTTKNQLIERITEIAKDTSFEVMLPFISSLKKDELLVLNQKIEGERTSSKFKTSSDLDVPVMKAVFITCQVTGKKLVSKKTIKTALAENDLDVSYAEIEASIDTLIKKKFVSYMRNAESKIPFFGLTNLGKEELKKLW